MSKRNMLLGLAAGKIGDLVFYRDGGEQRTRTRVIPKNPRSTAQMSQRVRIANVSATYRALKSILSDSFSTRPSHMSGYNAFARYAIPMSPFMSKEQALAQTIFPAPYIVSKGTIAPLDFVMGTKDGVPVLKLNASNQKAGDTTIGSVSANIIAQYPWLQNGDELTFVGIEFLQALDSSAANVFRARPVVQSFVLDTTDEGSIEDIALTSSAGALEWSFMEMGALAAAAVIVSRVDGNGTLDTSLSALALTSLASDLYHEFCSSNVEQKAIESYGVGSESVLRD